MKLAHNVKISVFIHEHEDPYLVEERFLSLVPFSLSDEKLQLKRSYALGFEDKRIMILELVLSRSSHVSKFIANLVHNLSSVQKALLLRQAGSRLDSDLNFFIRLDKDALLDDNKLQITDSGNCFHIRIAIAAFPAKRELGLKVVKRIFSDS